LDLTWTDEQMNAARKIAVQRFAQNSVAGHMAPLLTVPETETTVPLKRYNYGPAGPVPGVVVDREVVSLYEPYAQCRFTQAQVDEFASKTGDAESRVVTTITRAASALARYHDQLFFRGFGPPANIEPVGILQLAQPPNLPRSLREAAIDAEAEEGSGFVQVPAPVNEGLVSAVYEAVLRLESRGYYASCHLVLGETLWRELHRPTAGSMTLPRDRIEPTLLGGMFFRTTTLPPEEALLVSLDGRTFDSVIAGDVAECPRLEFLRAEPQGGEELYLFRIRERFAPRIHENRACVRLSTGAAAVRVVGDRA
jgi:uncharacterized linocin/CFP29 family protein